MEVKWLAQEHKTVTLASTKTWFAWFRFKIYELTVILLHLIRYTADLLFLLWITVGEMEILEHMETLKGKGNDSSQENKPPAAKVGILISRILRYPRAGLLGEKKSGEIMTGYYSFLWLISLLDFCRLLLASKIVPLYLRTLLFIAPKAHLSCFSLNRASNQSW